MIQKARMEILHVYFAIHTLWNHTLLQPLMWSCSYLVLNSKTKQKSLKEITSTSDVRVHWFLESSNVLCNHSRLALPDVHVSCVPIIRHALLQFLLFIGAVALYGSVLSWLREPGWKWTFWRVTFSQPAIWCWNCALNASVFSTWSYPCSECQFCWQVF